MIPSAKLTVAIIIFKRSFFCDILKSVDRRTETCAKIMIPTGQDCREAEWIKKDQQHAPPSFGPFQETTLRKDVSSLNVYAWLGFNKACSKWQEEHNQFCMVSEFSK